MILALTLSSCQVQQDQKALESFKALVRHHVDSYKPNGREHVFVGLIFEGKNLWIKDRFTIDPTSVNFDVQKTSSLVSPFVGTLTFTITITRTSLHPTKAEAAVDTDCSHETEVFLHRHVFVYQDSQWRPKSRQHRVEGEWRDCVFRNDVDVHGCLEEFDGDK